MTSSHSASQRLTGVSSMIPVALEHELHLTAATMRRNFGFAYSDTFCEVVTLGLQAIQAKGFAANRQSDDLIRKVRA